jgi:hypothetical protein
VRRATLPQRVATARALRRLMVDDRRFVHMSVRTLVQCEPCRRPARQGSARVLRELWRA